MVGASGVHFPARIVIHSDSARTNAIFDSGGLVIGNYYLLGGYYAYDCIITSPVGGTQLWFSLTKGTFQTIIHEIYFYTTPTGSNGVQIIKTDTAGATSNKAWDEYYQTSNAYWRLLSDNEARSSNWLNVTRNGLLTSSIRFFLGTASNLERVTFLSNGNVGIGTSTPQTRLDITEPGTNVSANVMIYAGGGGGASSTNQANLIFRVRGAGGGDVSASMRYDLVAGNYGFSMTDSNLNTVVRVDGTNDRVGINTIAPLVALDISGQGSSITIGRAGATSNGDGLLIQGYSNQGYIRPQAAASTLYLGAVTSTTLAVTSNRLGVNVTSPGYALDVTAPTPITAAAINMNSWPRWSFSNVTIVSGLTSLTPIGRTVNFSNATITMDSNLSTWVSSNATVGNSFRPLIAGIWSINVQGFTNTSGQWAWIDGSANNSATFASQAHNTVGNQNLSFAQPSGTAFSLHYTGYLSASNYYKIKISTAAAAGNNYWNAIFTFLGETSTTTAYPTRTT
jgi:hypothetical protein